MSHRPGRRGFLRTGLLVAAYSALRSRFALGQRRGKVLVVGAGVAGLGAARELRSRGFDVTVLEGRDRVGGRIWTDRSLGSPVDMGAAWIEGIEGNPVIELADELGAEHGFSDDESWVAYDHDGTRLSDSELEDVDEAGEEIGEALEELAEELSVDISVEEGIRRVLEDEDLSAREERGLDWFISVGIEGSAAAPASKLSLLEGSDDGFDGDDHLVHGGYEAIPLGLARDLDVRLGHVVQEIAHDSRGVRIESSGGSFAADFAVVTLPLGVLQAGMVTFSPALPESKRQALRSLAMGTANKVVLAFTRIFWQEQPHFLGYLSQTRGEFSNFVNLVPFLRKPILAAYLSGDFALAAEPWSNEETVERAMRVLRVMYGRAIPEPVGFAVSRWGADPFSRGAYSYVPVGGDAGAYDVLAEPLGNRIFFAGEATNGRYYATVHGAFLSGLREASRIAKL